MIVVADASPIICLSRIGRLDLLRDVFTEILVPDEVRDEVAAGPDGEAILRSHPWIESRPVHNRNRLATLANEMDIGEAAAIVLTIETRAELLLMDERRGRAVAEREGLTVIGVAGVLLRAKAPANYGFNGSELTEIERMVQEHRTTLLEAWHEHFGQ